MIVEGVLSERRLVSRASTMAHALVFVAGFGLVFTVGWGGTATLLGELFGRYRFILGKVGGVLVILFGLYTIGVLRVPWLSRDLRPSLPVTRSRRLGNAALLGIVFAAGWTPCIGTTLGAILTLSLSQDTSNQGIVLASGYSLGLALPFLGLALVLNRALRLVRRVGRYRRILVWASGGLLLTIGVLLLTDRMTLIAIWAQRNGYYFDLPLGSAPVPSYAVAVAAGALSFLSPCVLPLVPAYLAFLSGEDLRLAEPAR